MDEGYVDEDSTEDEQSHIEVFNLRTVYDGGQHKEYRCNEDQDGEYNGNLWSEREREK